MSKVTVKLFASLMEYLPINSTKHHGFDYDITKNPTVGYLIDDLKLPRNVIHIVLLNGVYLDAGIRDATVLSEGDTLGFWPPVAGG
ncbi:MAG: molybdopterin synthase sulfur carrier subunit [Piscirickettsiaceae bacterium]|nr:MAG: molybdopterin synthase sulfur carrier subunit [Piscirickettsiaceae bacterium]